MKLEYVVIAGQHPAVNMPLLLAHTARQTTLVGSGRGLAFWRARIWVQRGGLSRNKVSVGEPADGSPPKIEGWLPSAKLNFECHTPLTYSNQIWLEIVSNIIKRSPVTKNNEF